MSTTDSKASGKREETPGNKDAEKVDVPTPPIPAPAPAPGPAPAPTSGPTVAQLEAMYHETGQIRGRFFRLKNVPLICVARFAGTAIGAEIHPVPGLSTLTVALYAQCKEVEKPTACALIFHIPLPKLTQNRLSNPSYIHLHALRSVSISGHNLWHRAQPFFGPTTTDILRDRLRKLLKDARTNDRRAPPADIADEGTIGRVQWPSYESKTVSPRPIVPVLAVKTADAPTRWLSFQMSAMSFEKREASALLALLPLFDYTSERKVEPVNLPPERCVVPHNPVEVPGLQGECFVHFMEVWPLTDWAEFPPPAGSFIDPALLLSLLLRGLIMH